MARTILDDYYKHTSNHFELAFNIPRRAREIQRRGDALVAERGDKPIVVALREISERAHADAPAPADAESAGDSAAAAEAADGIAEVPGGQPDSE